MARRGRGSSARTKAAPNGRSLPEVADDEFEPGDEPGARTIGALALKRWVARGPGRGDVGDDGGDGPRTHGPFDEDDAALAPAGQERVDFGAVRVPVPRGGEVSVEPEDGRLQAVHVMLPAGRLSVSALAAPRTERLWPDLAAEIDESLREGGATVRSFTGEWGRELHARTGDASSLFVGVDGPRWMLYGVATGPTSAAAELDAALRTMLRGTVVVRGRSPYPVRTVLPLTIPDELSRIAPPAVPDRVPVPRTPPEPVAPARRPAPPVDAPTTITTVAPTVAPTAADGVDTVPHGIPRSVPGDEFGRPAPRPRPAAAAREEAPAAEPAPGPADLAGPETDVSRTASRGLFRRRPERPPARTSQKRVADLIAQAERDRAAADRATADRAGTDHAGDPPARPERRATNGTAVNGAVHGAVTGDAGREVGGARANGYIPRELTHDHPTTNGASALRFGDQGAGEHDGPATNGAGHAAHFGGSFLNGAPHDPAGHDRAGHDRAGYDRSPSDEPRVNGAATGGSPYDAAPFEGSYGAPQWSSAYSPASDVPSSSGIGDRGVDRWADLGSGVDDGPVGAIEATVWAAMLHDEPRPSSGLPPDGSDDWTLPLPVVRPAPEPVRPPSYEPPSYGSPSYGSPSSDAPRGRRARREAEERAAGHRAPERWDADRWTPDPADRYGGPDRSTPGAHSAERRHTRSGRHSEEARDPGGHAERARHRRPER